MTVLILPCIPNTQAQFMAYHFHIDPGTALYLIL